MRCCQQVIKPEGQSKYFVSVGLNKKGRDRQGPNHKVTEGDSNANMPYGLYTCSDFELVMPYPAVTKFYPFFHCLQSMFLFSILLYSTQKRIHILFIQL